MIMKNNKSTAHTPKELLTELQTLVAEAESLVGNTGEASEDIMSSLRSRYEAVQERMVDFYDNTRRKVIAGAKYTDTTIRENPYQAMAVAAGFGLLLGIILGRRSTR
jgi:ElaB/YqjD/DUF883 family membrane-anchored ribosome-binding protein